MWTWSTQFSRRPPLPIPTLPLHHKAVGRTFALLPTFALFIRQRLVTKNRVSDEGDIIRLNGGVLALPQQVRKSMGGRGIPSGHEESFLDEDGAFLQR